MAEQPQGSNGSAANVLEQVKNAIREAVRRGMGPTLGRLRRVEQRVEELERRVAELEGDKPHQ